MAEMVRSAAGVVGSAVVQDGVTRVVSFMLGKREEKASKGDIIERLETAHSNLELVLERSSKLPITDRSLLRPRKKLKRVYEECGNVLDRCKLPALEDQENEQGVTRFSSAKRIVRTTISSISSLVSRNKDVLGYSDVVRFERYAASADKFMQDLESGYSLRQYMFSNPLIRRLLQGTTLRYRMVQGSQKQYLRIQPMNFAERGVEAFLVFSNIDRKTPEKSFLVALVLRLSESTNILGVTIKCLRSLLKPPIKSAVEAAMGELDRLPTQDISDSYASTWIDEFHAKFTHRRRPNPECCKADGHGTSTLPYRLPEEVIGLCLTFSVTPYALGILLSPHRRSRKQDLQEGGVQVVRIRGTEAIERRKVRNVSLKVEEMVLLKAIDCLNHRPEVTHYSVRWQTPHGRAWFIVEKDGHVSKRRQSLQITAS